MSGSGRCLLTTGISRRPLNAWPAVSGPWCLLLVCLKGFFPATAVAEGLPEIHICCPSGEESASAANLTTGVVGEMSLWDADVSVDIVDDSLKAFAPTGRLEEVVEYPPGLSASAGQGEYSTVIAARGFQTSGEVFLNGHRDNWHFHVRDLATVDRVEILKGHASVLYGSGSPAATINYLSKRPLRVQGSTVGLTVGNHAFRRAEFDVTGPLDQDRRIAYRVAGAGQKGDTLYNNVDDDRWVIFPSLEWYYSENGSIRVELEYDQNRRPYAFGTVYTDGRVLFDHSYVFPEANADRRSDRIGLYWRHAFSLALEGRVSLNRYRTFRDDLHIGFYNKKCETELNGYYRKVNDHYWQDVAKAELQASFPIMEMPNNLVMGLELNKDTDEVRSQRNIGGFTLDPFDPDFDVDLTTLSLTQSDYTWRDSERALYFLDRLAVTDRWAVEAGMRYSDFDATFSKRGKDYDLSDSSNLSSHFGIVWRPTPYTALHAHVTEAFEPNIGTDRNDDFFDPKQSRQIELGMKYRFATAPTELSVVGYQLRQSNLTTKDPVDPDYLALLGERESRGVEVELDTRLNDEISAKLAGTRVDAETVEDNNGHKGNSPASAPRYMSSLRIDYRPKGLQGLTFSAFAIKRSSMWGDDANSFTVPGYTRYDLGLGYKHDFWEARLDIANLTDERYVVAANGDDDLYQGGRKRIWFELIIDQY